MPSPEHDTLNLLFRSRPAFAVEILADLFEMESLDGAMAHVAPADFNDRLSVDFQADSVIIAGPQHDPEHGIVIEIQQAINEDKRETWPRYAAALWLRLRRPVTVLAVCPDPKVAAWAAKPIATGLPGFTLTPRVLGPEAIPAVTDLSCAIERPELAAMSVMVHGDRPDVVEVFLAALEKVDPEHAPQYYEYAYRLASPATKRLLEEIMTSTTWPVYSPFAKEHFYRGKEVGMEEGRAQGREEGREEGREVGREEGMARGEAHCVLMLLEHHGVAVSEEVRQRILSCNDLDQLAQWVLRAGAVTTTDELFG
ncbi:hypothetical protein [Nonomuraea sp. NPDC003804]|uniref:hypothetical protein n=1 Tax=Nonomuraea sp. NPDC003804 TaxID=3154547 RepID=UPI0033B68F9E